MDVELFITNENHLPFAKTICELIEASAKQRGTGIALREVSYIEKKIKAGDAILALKGEEFVGFCYIEIWSNQKYVANSGLIVHPDYRKLGLARRIKAKAFQHAQEKYPNARVIGITTSAAVMKINSDLGYRPVPFSELTQDETFWNGCQSCPNYDILQRNERQICLCTGMLASAKTEKWKHEQNKTLVLAYSGGLDTSYCIKYLTLHGWEVHAVAINTGGFDKEEIQTMEKQANQLGAVSFRCIEATKEYYEKVIRYLIFGNVLRNNTYPLSVSAERMFQAVAIAQVAKELDAKAIAHGSTGAGNDQVRFDLAFRVLCPEIEIITPIRDQELSRQEEVEFLKKHGFEWNVEKAKYSINQGIWGTSVGGAETLTSHSYLPEHTWQNQLQKTENEEEVVELYFLQGELVGINEQEFEHPLDAIEALQKIAAPYAIGRDIHVGDTIIGIKGRVGFEAAAPMIIIKAHHLLEKHVLGKWQAYWKEQLANWYGMMLHEGQYLDGVMRNIETFLEDTQEPVTGKVFVKLYPYRFDLQGIVSEFDRMQMQKAHYGEITEGWTGEDVKGFTKILANHFSDLINLSNKHD